jgi:hypothetical protein
MGNGPTINNWKNAYNEKDGKGISTLLMVKSKVSTIINRKKPKYKGVFVQSQSCFVRE